MKAASISDIKKELAHLDTKALGELCLRLAKYKNENKEFLTYLLFEAHDEQSYIREIKNDIDEAFGELKNVNLYQTKKSLRKILRITNKQIKFSGKETTELELRIYYLTKLKTSGIPFERSPVLVNLYNQQLKKINGVLSKLPEDLQLDYERDVARVK